MTIFFDKSWAIYNESKKYLAQGSSTSSKIPVSEKGPAIIERGKGCRIWDSDGNEYIDFRNGLGPVTLGYAISELNATITRQLQDGVIFGYQYSCRPNAGGSHTIKKWVQEHTGIPVLSLEMDIYDSRFYSAGALKTRIESFSDILRARKALN